jgi:hypothetical protein
MVMRMVMIAAIVMTVLMGFAVLHASIVRDEMRFRTSTITRYAHMRNERNNMSPSGSDSPHRNAHGRRPRSAHPPIRPPTHPYRDNSKKRRAPV